jgi:pimeloyl-ACP methyl ester carboxylesterase
MSSSEEIGTPDTIVLIHGLWMTPRSWEKWIERFQSRGCNVLAPAWPGMEAEVEALRRDPSAIAAQDVRKILDHYDKIIRELDRPPIIIGHSFGGAFAQLLAHRGLGAAVVSLDGATVRGVRDLPLSTLRSSAALLRNPFARHKAVPFTFEQFRYAFGNTLDEVAAREAYDRYAIPGSRNVLLQGAMANTNPRTPFRVDFGEDERAPLLFIGGGEDHVIPAKVSRKMAGRYRKSKALTAYKEFPGRSHFTAGEPGWEEVADFALSWATEHARTGTAVHA